VKYFDLANFSDASTVECHSGLIITFVHIKQNSKNQYSLMGTEIFGTDTDAYYEQVNALIASPQEKVLHNDDCVLTYIVMRSMFEQATGDIRMFCEKFSIFQTSFKDSIEADIHYPEGVRREVILRFREAVGKFLEKGHSLIAIIENPGEWKEEEKNGGYFAQLFKQYSSQIELKTATNKFYELLGITFFDMAPTMNNNMGAVRWEVGTNKEQAIVSSSATMYRNHDKIFKQLNRFAEAI
jgi:hypothetical protein